MDSLKRRGLENKGKSSTIGARVVFARAGTGSLKTYYLPKTEYAKVMHELNTNLSAKELAMDIVFKPIGNYIYMVEIHEFGDYRILGKKPIR